MRGAPFEEANLKLLPPEGHEDEVYALPVWRHPEGGMVISKWKMTWRERFACLFRGYVWFHCWGNTHPPMSIETSYPFQRDTDGLKRGLKFAIPIGLILWAIVGYFVWRAYQ